MVPEATDDASLGRVYAANGSIPEVKDVPDKVFELLDFQLLGRRIRQSAGGVFTRQGYVVPEWVRQSPATNTLASGRQSCTIFTLHISA